MQINDEMKNRTKLNWKKHLKTKYKKLVESSQKKISPGKNSTKKTLDSLTNKH